MDAMTDPRIERVVLMTSARIGKTQALNNLVGFHIHQDPAPMLLVLPSIERAEEWADDEFDPMVRDTPALRAILGERKSRASKQRRTHRQFPGGRLYMVGANAPSGLAAKTVRLVLMDEVDRFPPSAGDEGDPVTLAEKRAATIWNRKLVLSSTPTIAGVSRIETAYQASDRRRFWVPCPHCGHAQHLRWGQVRWTDGRPETARYHCEDCGAGWTDAERYAAVSRGEWRAEGEPCGVAGFHLNEIYSPFRRLAETVRDFVGAKDHPARLKVWVNTALGETWQEKGDAPEWERLIERREDYPAGVAPAGVLAITGGVDVQTGADARVELYLWGWGPGLERWLLAHRVWRGDPDTPAIWDELAADIDRPWRREDGRTLRVLRCAVDTGHATAVVYAQIRRVRDGRLLAVKGAERIGSGAIVAGPTLQDVTEGGRKIKRGLRLWTVNTSALKAELYQALGQKRVDEAFPRGWVHLPTWAEPETVRQIVSEELRTVKDKRGFTRQEWAKLRDRNEALDCAVYARAALWVAGADRQGERFWQRVAAEIDGAPDPVEAPVEQPAAVHVMVQQQRPVVPVPAPPARRSGGYFGGWR